MPKYKINYLFQTKVIGKKPLDKPLIRINYMITKLDNMTCYNNCTPKYNWK